MIELYDGPVVLLDGGKTALTDPALFDQEVQAATGAPFDEAAARRGTIAAGILEAHGVAGAPQDGRLHLKFDSITSHDITYVGIIQTAIASGMKEFPLPYVLTNCHNSLCAVGGTINEDDHKFALSAAKKFGGTFVPPMFAVIHSYNREMMAGCGRMILGSDSHTRYGALGTMAVGEGGGELAKQLLKQTYDMAQPPVVAVRLTGAPQRGVGPQDVALQLIKAVFASGFVKNAALEFVGPGVASLPIEFRNGIDVMTTETTCWSSIWQTDDETKSYFENHGRPEAYTKLEPARVALYDRMVDVDLSAIVPSIALPFHPSNVYSIAEVQDDAARLFAECEETSAELFAANGVRVDLQSKIHGGKVHVDQASIVGCAGGTFDNIAAAADIMAGASIGNDVFSMTVYPGSQPIYLDLLRQGIVTTLMEAGAVIKPAFCGPCFGAGDTPANNELSIRHATRNFPNRDGSKPTEEQVSSVALMDARSIAATARNKGVLTAADQIEWEETPRIYHFDKSVYEKRVLNDTGKADTSKELVSGPNIKPWPELPKLPEHLVLEVASYITDPVTTTDELIPSGETSSYRSNPLRLAEFTLSRKDPEYVGRAKDIHRRALAQAAGESLADDEKFAPYKAALEAACAQAGIKACGSDKAGEQNSVVLSSTIFALKPGDGSAREQAASCQRVLGATGNIAVEYATKRYRSNLINWGIVPFETPRENTGSFGVGSYIFVPNVRAIIESGKSDFNAFVLGENGTVTELPLTVGALGDKEREILLDGSLIGYNRNRMA